MDNPYEALGVSPNATAEEIEQAARSHARRHHPDAGGDREAFDRGRRALIVLRDPKKREAFDRDGTVDDRPENYAFSEAINIITTMLEQLLANQHIDPETVDITAQIRQQLKQNRANIVKMVADQQQQIRRLEKVAKRLKLKAGVDKENLLTATVNAQIGAHRAQMAQGAQHIETADVAIAILEDYIYEVEPRPSPYANTARAGGWTLPGTWG